MENLGEIYFKRGEKFFELERYEQAVQDWICAYEAGYNREQILDVLYQCFILPNIQEFQKNYELNNEGFSSLSCEDCALDFIPVSEDKFYIWDKTEKTFHGVFCLERVTGSKLEFDGVLYTDIWDIREIISDMERQTHGLVYLLLGQVESKFVSFFKLPMFRKLYLEKIVLFHDAISMQEFFVDNEKYCLPRIIVTADVTKYEQVLKNIQNEKKYQVSKFGRRNLLLLKGQSQYGALRRMVDDLAKALRRAGYNTLVLDATRETAWQQLDTMKHEYEFDAVITFNAMLIDVDDVRKLGKKYCAIMGDHPIWHDMRLKCADENTIICYGDSYDANYVKKYYPNVGKVECLVGSSSFLKEDHVYANRRFDLVFTGGYNDPKEIYEQICDMYDGAMLILAKSFINKLVTHPNKTYEGALMETLRDYGQGDISDEQFKELAAEFCMVNRYVRSYFRDEIIRKIIESDIKIHVSGNGWEDFESEYKDNLVIEKNDWYTAKKMIANAKISLNIMPWFKAGFHDRAATSLLSGAVLLTDSSEYLEEQFSDMENIALFNLDHLEELPKKIKFLLENETVAESIAEAGQRKAELEYTWDNYSKRVIEVLKEALDDHTECTAKGYNLLQIRQGLRRKEVAIDILTDLYETEELLDVLQDNSMFEAEDYQFCVARLVEEARRLVLEFPDIEVGYYVWDIISNRKEEFSAEIVELIRMQISYLERMIIKYGLK